MLTPGELAQTRRDMMGLMSDTVVVERYNVPLGRWDTVATTVGRAIAKRSVTRDSGGALVGVTLWNVLMPHDAPVLVNDRLTIGSHTYWVTGTDVDATGAPALVVQCSRVGE